MMLSSFLKTKRGFTLVELMIVVAIISILAAVALPQFAAYRKKARAKELVSFARACFLSISIDCWSNEGSHSATYPAASTQLAACNVAFGNSNIESGIQGGTTGTGQLAIGSDACGAINVSSAITIQGTPFNATCAGAWNTNMTCVLTP